uniref:Sema domain-containing protein n=1 Tax=Syphacia muris TaxID=451379 RepID=A0A0N5A982_9BILA
MYCRDVVYNISVESFKEVQVIKWPSEAKTVKECLKKGRPEGECHNYIRVLAKDGIKDTLICGTNSYEPKCRRYERESNGDYGRNVEFQAQGLSPYDPYHNSTYLRDGDMFDFSGFDALVHRRNISKISDLGIRTLRGDTKSLNEPQFTGSFRDEKYVYMWFREKADQLQCCEQNIISRVARICRSDNGGPSYHSNEWTSFVKARLNCSIPGDYPFYFDQIEAIAKPTSGIYLSEKKPATLIYGVFGSPYAGVSSSAICAYDLEEISYVFAHSTYVRSDSNRYTPWVESAKKYQPGVCVENSQNLSQEQVIYTRAHLLADDAIQNFFKSPVAIHSGSDRFTHISVDSQVQAVDGRYYDLIYVGTDSGNILKLVNLIGAGVQTDSPTYHVYTIYATNEPIRNMALYKGDKLVISDYVEANESYLIVVSDSAVLRIPPTQCSKFKTCYDCVLLRDPHCAWDPKTSRCIRNNGETDELKQDIVAGNASKLCTMEMRPEKLIVSSATLQSVSDKGFGNCSCDSRKSINGCSPGTVASFPTVITAESKYASFSDRSAIILLCFGFFGLGSLFTFFISRVYNYWKIPQKENSSILQSLFSTQSRQDYSDNNNAQRRLPNLTSDNVINAYDQNPKFICDISTSISPVSLNVTDVENSLKLRVNNSDSATLPKDFHKQMYL